MSIKATVEEIAGILESIEGVQRVYARPPMALSDVDLPAFLVFPGPAQYKSEGHGMGAGLAQRVYQLRLYVAPLAHGDDGEVWERCEPFFGRIVAAFSLLDEMDDPDVLRAYLLGDAGLGVFRHAEIDYLGTEFRLQVEEIPYTVEEV